MPSVVHITIVHESKFPFGCPSGFIASIQVPFSEISSSISVIGQCLGKCHHFISKRKVVGCYSILLRIHPGHETSARRAANRMGCIIIQAQGTPARQSINVGSFYLHFFAPRISLFLRKLFTIATQCAKIVFVSHDNQNVRTVLCHPHSRRSNTSHDKHIFQYPIIFHIVVPKHSIITCSNYFVWSLSLFLAPIWLSIFLPFQDIVPRGYSFRLCLSSDCKVVLWGHYPFLSVSAS